MRTTLRASMAEENTKSLVSKTQSLSTDHNYSGSESVLRTPACPSGQRQRLCSGPPVTSA